MAPSRHAWSTFACVASLLAAAPLAAMAEELTPVGLYEYSQLRVGWMSMSAPAAKQTNPVSESWNGGDSRGSRFSMTYLTGVAPTDGLVGTVWGGMLNLSSFNLGDGGTESTLVQPTVDVAYGWQYGILETDSLRGFAELLPFVGLGMSSVEIGDRRRLGWATEAGLKAAVILTERNWELGITAMYLLGLSRVSYTPDASNEKSTYEFTSSDFGMGIEGGYRF
jgi:hypothetical protein